VGGFNGGGGILAYTKKGGGRGGGEIDNPDKFRSTVAQKKLRTRLYLA